MFMEGLISQAGSIESFRVGAAGFFGSSNTNNIDAEEKRYVGQQTLLDIEQNILVSFLFLKNQI